MLDFTSSLYLGQLHSTSELRPWRAFTTGKPAALEQARDAGRVAKRLAMLQGLEAGTLGPSTLHLFWDLIEILTGKDVVVFMDAGTYPIARWGVERAAARGRKVRSFRHRDSEGLQRDARLAARRGYRPLIVADGFCPGCGRIAPLRSYQEAARRHGGWLVVDDTQALGILGGSMSPAHPFGVGGGGSHRFAGLDGTAVVFVSSLAKGFGVPLAVLSGSPEIVQEFEDRSATRIHCSAPSLPAIAAAEHALHVNRRDGETLRSHLLKLVRRFRSGMDEAGIVVAGGWFPVQTLGSVSGPKAEVLHAQLIKAGIHTVLHCDKNQNSARISLLLSAQHRAADIDQAVATIVKLVKLMTPKEAKNVRRSAN